MVLDGFSLALPDFAGIETEIVGTPQCMAPEMILGAGYGRGVDWWGLGVLVHELLTGESPFNGDTPEELFKAITTGNSGSPGRRTKHGRALPPSVPKRSGGAAGAAGAVRLGLGFSKPAQDLVEGLLCRKPSERLGGTVKGGVFGLRFHAFFAHPEGSATAIDWTRLRKGDVPAPFHVSALTRAAAATTAYGTAKDLGWAQQQQQHQQQQLQPQEDGAQSEGWSVPTGTNNIDDYDNDDEVGADDDERRDELRPLSRQAGTRPATRGSSTADFSLRGSSRGSSVSTTSTSYLGDFQRAVTPGSFESLPYPAPLTAGSAANALGPAGLDVLGFPSRPSSSASSTRAGSKSAMAAAAAAAAAQKRPSTRERAIPFQFQLASLQAKKTTGLVREEQAAIDYGLAVTELAKRQGRKLVAKELQSQQLLESGYD